ncbi:Urb2/Npa2 family-domain-containing protein [Apiosordaria backusii]|uniref:Urb2/Npa2 family-domain-containing protein n=1 Tax=Apiosordaria backusii TaxID=314023 RepID=A0AA40BEF3_9PEZI|nr:Urb2/Npa2 family-domain-containing protein [Apiosordaria backusii]
MKGQAMTGEAALIGAVQAFNKDTDIETLPERLESVWDILSEYHGGNFHAAEEMLSRSLLKQMAGSTANAERVRRYPRTWNVLGAVFARTPLFSLAKSLADWKFIGILQQTLKELRGAENETQPQTNGTKDVEMADAPAPESSSSPRKRKRPDSLVFNIEAQRTTAGCLQTAEALLEALRILLARCEIKLVDEPPTHRMGAEHVKSLFSLSAADAIGILVPILHLCTLAVDGAVGESYREQSSWLSTLNSVWGLHLQGPSDASEVASHLSHLATRLLGKLTDVADTGPLGIESSTQERWTRDLRRFLSRNLILPARAAFLNKGGQSILQTAVEVSAASAPMTFPVIFDLVGKSPREVGGNTSIKDYETWVQAVFDTIFTTSKTIHFLKGLAGREALTAMRRVLKMAAERGAVLTAQSLRSVCKEYALGQRSDDWSLLLSIVTLNPDAFLLSDEGKELLDQILDKTKYSSSLNQVDQEKSGQFIVLLANGYAQARDLSSFVKTWLKYLDSPKSEGKLEPLWAQKELVDTVAKLVQSSLNADQLAELVAWLSSQEASAGKVFILAALSSGVTREEFVDAANMKIFDAIMAQKVSKKDAPVISACRWDDAARTLAEGTLEEAGQVWSQVGSYLKKTLKKSSADDEDTFAAFKCCVAAWLSNYLEGPDEEETSKLVCSFLGRLEEEASDSESKSRYVSWILEDEPRLVSMVVDKIGKVPDIILALVKPNSDDDMAGLTHASTVGRVLLKECDTGNQKLTDTLIDTVITVIDESEAGTFKPSTKDAVLFLLSAPMETLSRSQREAIMKTLIAHLPRASKKGGGLGVEYWKPVLSLMIKLMEEPTFYDGMSFSHLETIGGGLLSATDDVAEARHIFRLLHQLAVLTIRQMASGNLDSREKSYLSGAKAALQGQASDNHAVARIVLLHAFFSTVQEPKTVPRLEKAGLDFSGLGDVLFQIASSVVTAGKWRGMKLLALLFALDALDSLGRDAIKRALSSAVKPLLKTSNKLVDEGIQAGWAIRMFLADHFLEALESPFKIKLDMEVSEQGEIKKTAIEVPVLRQYVDAVVRHADESTKLQYLKELLLEDCPEQNNILGRLLIIDQLVHHLKGSRPSPTSSPQDFDLAKAHSILTKSLPALTALPHIIQTTKTILSLLDQSPASMKQFNIDLTLSRVSLLANSSPFQSLVVSQPHAYQPLCSLLEVIIKRHRHRLEGHFHVLLSPLQDLLRLLLSRCQSNTPTWEKNAQCFSRLLTLICEPTAATTAASGGSNHVVLESEKDRAKRYAGQYMYLVLMQYVKCQLEYAAPPHAVKETLEKEGMYTIIRITSLEGLKIMSEGMDGGGGWCLGSCGGGGRGLGGGLGCRRLGWKKVVMDGCIYLLGVVYIITGGATNNSQNPESRVGFSGCLGT